jgi:thioredoxin reductase
MAKLDTPRIAILGAGPVGLEAARYARSLQLPVTLYEAGQVGEHLRHWGFVRLFSPFSMNVTSLGRNAICAENPRHEFPGDQDCITGAEHLRTYLEPLARTSLLRDCLRINTRLLHLGRRGCLKTEAAGDPRRAAQPFRLLLREGGTERIDEADIVLDCTGTYGQHRWLGEGGIPAVGELAAEANIAYGLEDVTGKQRNAYAGKNLLVIGAGYSAATTVCNLAALAQEHPDTWVIWLARGKSTQPIRRIANDPLKERDRLGMRANTLATRGEGNVEFHPQTMIDGLEPLGQGKGFRVRGRCAGKSQTWDVDRIIANVGYTPNTQLYRELQVHECYASLGPMKLAAALAGEAGADCLQQRSHGADTLRNPEPNFYILGAKSYGRNSQFLLRIGFEQVREVFTLILKKPDLNLYGKR